jgi:hypothetical protein
MPKIVSLAFGERLCETYEADCACYPRTEVQLEELIALRTSLADGDFIRLGKCQNCKCLIIVGFDGNRDIATANGLSTRTPDPETPESNVHNGPVPAISQLRQRARRPPAVLGTSRAVTLGRRQTNELHNPNLFDYAAQRTDARWREFPYSRIWRVRE